MKKYIGLILFAIAVSSCIYPFEAEFSNNAPDRLVIYGDILIGEQTQIDLGYVMSLGKGANTTNLHYPSGSVVVENDRRGVFTGSRVKRGRYVVNTSTAPADARYRLVVKLDDGREFTTPWADVMQAPEITDVSYIIDDDNLILQCSMDGRDSVRHFCWDYDEVWEYHAYFIPTVVYANGLFVERENYNYYYYCWNTHSSLEPCIVSAEAQADNKIENCAFLTIPRTDYRLSQLYSITISAKGLTSDAKAYLEHQISISNNTGDLFSPIPSEMRGNISCTGNPDDQAIGYVSVCERSSRRMFIGSAGIYTRPFDPETLLFYPERDEDGYHFNELFLTCSPVDFTGVEPNATNVRWGDKICTDCRAWGGTKTKPAWWPNDDE